MNGVFFRDSENNPILYFPAAPGKPNIRGREQPGNVPGYVEMSARSLYDARDGISFFRRATEPDDTDALKAIRVMLGDFTDGSPPDGIINGNEKPASEAPYLLWTAGPDGLFGPIRPGPGWTPEKRDIDKCDDITNFLP
jgi:hypothetical protein